MDGIKIEDIEEMGIEKYLSEIKSELREGKYKPSPVVDQHIIIWHFRRIKLWRNNAGIFHPRTPGILVITVIEKNYYRYNKAENVIF